VWILNVATGEASAEATAQSSDWFELRDQLVLGILRKLGVTVAEEERIRMRRRWTASDLALECYSKALALRAEQKPRSQGFPLLAQAIEADRRFVEAQLELAAACAERSEFGRAQDSAREALLLKPDDVRAHVYLGKILVMQKQYADAEKEYGEALRLAPDDSMAWHALGEWHWAQQKVEQATVDWKNALRSDPTSAELHAHLAWAYALEGSRENATAELKQAEWYNPESDSTGLLLAGTYAALHDFPAALQQIDKHLAWMSEQGISAQAEAIEKWGRDLRARLVPSYFTNSPPKRYTAQSFAAELKKRLSVEELREVINPIEASPAMTNWAQGLALGAKDDREKARKLFHGLACHFASGPGGTRTAQEVFAAWNSPNGVFSCQEFAKLFVAMARAVGVDSFYVHLEKDYAGTIVYHDCAAVFVEGKGLLVDPTYVWFGAPHKDFVVLDDVQTVAHHYFQRPERDPSSWLARCRVAEKLHPDFAWGQCMLAEAFLQAERPLDAGKAVNASFLLDPDRWDSYQLRGIIAAQKGQADTAAVSLRKSIALNPDCGPAHFALAHVYLDQGNSKGATVEFHAVLQANPDPAAERDATRHLAELREGLRSAEKP
jgi:tetratricopeptide (TPR) repeat protein